MSDYTNKILTRAYKRADKVLAKATNHQFSYKHNSADWELLRAKTKQTTHTRELEASIIRRVVEGRSILEIAAELNTTRSYIDLILTRAALRETLPRSL